MRIIDKVERLGRRDFLGRSAGALAAAVVVGPALANAAVVPLKTVKPGAAPTLVKMARDLYPHDILADVFYENALATIDGNLAAIPASATLLTDGVAVLDAAAIKLRGKPYVAIAAEADRVAVLKTIEATPIFKTMRSGMVTALYDQPALWTKLGYEGSSAEKGGYIHRGFNDIDWLPA